MALIDLNCLERFLYNLRQIYDTKIAELEARITVLEEGGSSSFTNLVPTSTDTSGDLYYGTGYREGYRLNYNGIDVSQAGSIVSGYIPYSGQILRVYGDTNASLQNANGQYVATYDANFNKIASMTGANLVNGGATWEQVNGKSLLTINPNGFNSTTYKNYFLNASYIRCSFTTCAASDFVVTLDEEIN